MFLQKKTIETSFLKVLQQLHLQHVSVVLAMLIFGRKVDTHDMVKWFTQCNTMPNSQYQDKKKIDVPCLVRCIYIFFQSAKAPQQVGQHESTRKGKKALCAHFFHENLFFLHSIQISTKISVGISGVFNILCVMPLHIQLLGKSTVRVLSQKDRLESAAAAAR